jgi:DNA-directed RNA polymerase specialized sigma24 family protein
MRDAKPADESAKPEPFSNVLRAIEQNDEQAVEDLWARFYPRLVRRLATRFGHTPRPVVDEEDLASEVLTILTLEIQAGRLRKVDSWGALWGCACLIAKCRFAAHRRSECRQKRRGAPVQHADFAALDSLADRPCPPEYPDELIEDLFSLLRFPRDNRLWGMLFALTAGVSRAELIGKLPLSRRNIETALHDFLRRYRNKLRGGGLIAYATRDYAEQVGDQPSTRPRKPTKFRHIIPSTSGSL